MPQGGLTMLEINKIPEGFISNLHTEEQDTQEVLRGKLKYFKKNFLLQRDQLRRASDKFTDILCAYRETGEIPRSLIQSMANILGGK